MTVYTSLSYPPSKLFYHLLGSLINTLNKSSIAQSLNMRLRVFQLFENYTMKLRKPRAWLISSTLPSTAALFDRYVKQMGIQRVEN